MLIFDGVELRQYNFVVQNIEGRGAPPLSLSSLEVVHGSYVSSWRFEERTITIEGIVWDRTAEEARIKKDAVVRLFSRCAEQPRPLTFSDTGRTVWVRLKGEPVVVRTIGPTFASLAFRITAQFVATDPFFVGTQDHNEEGTGYVRVELFAPMFLAGDPGVVFEPVASFPGGVVEVRNNLFDITKASAGVRTPLGLECWNGISGLPSSPSTVNFNVVYLKNNVSYTLYVEAKSFSTPVCRSIKAGDHTLCGQINDPVFTSTFTFSGTSDYYQLSIDVTNCHALLKRVVLVEKNDPVPLKDVTVTVRVPALQPPRDRVEKGFAHRYSSSGLSVEPVVDAHQWIAPGVWYVVLPSGLGARFVGKRRYLEG